MPILDTLMFGLAVLGSTSAPASEPSAGVRYSTQNLQGQFQDYERAMVQTQLEPMKELKIDPREVSRFTHLTVGFGRLGKSVEFTHRFRVFTENGTHQREFGDPSARALLRMWDYNINRMYLDHSREILGGAIDVYLTDRGNPGGEQMFTMDPFTTGSDGKPRKVNVIYIYRIAQPHPNVERLRELAHEYGHATLWPAGGFSAPERMVNGELGERLYMKFFRDQLAAGKLSAEDVLLADVPALDAYLAKNYQPLLEAGASSGPQAAVLGKKDEPAFRSWLSLALWSQAVLPPQVFNRGMTLGSDLSDPTALPKGLADGAAERAKLEITLPAWAATRRVWLPVGQGKVTGGRVTAKGPDGWAQVAPTSRTILIENPPVKQA